MSITKKLANIFAGVVVALVAFGMMASSAAALTMAELDAYIAKGFTAEWIMANVSGGSSTGSTGTSTCVAIDTTTVAGIQTAINDLGYAPALVVDGVKGAKTTAGVKYLQAMVGANADGVFGPATRAAYNSYVAANCAEETPEPTPEEPKKGELSGGETSLSSFSLDSEDDAQEGEEMHVATLEFDVDDADAMLNRLDLTFDNTSVGGTADDEPWDVFDTITLMIDGDEIASEDIDDEDDWLDNDLSATDNEAVFRLSGLDYVVEEDETVEIEIYLTAASNVDDTANANWILGIANDGLRVLDGEGLTSYYDTNDTALFGIDPEGGDEDIEIKSSSNDPDAALLKVEEDEESDWYEVFEFRLEAEENDIDVDDLVLDFLLTNVDYSVAIDDVMVEIDGDPYDDFSVDLNNPTAAATDAQLTFDIDGDHTIDADDTVDVVVMVKLKKGDQNGVDDGVYDDANVKTLQVGVRSVDGEGVDDVDATSTINGKAHTLTYAAVAISNVSWAATPNPNGGNGTLDFFFTVDNSDGDADFALLAADIADTATAGFVDATTAITNSGEGTLSRVGGDAAPAIGGVPNTGFTVAEGDETRFRVRYDTGAANPGTYEASVTEVSGVEIDDNDELSPTLVV